jgi:hypothetical protein
VYTLAALCLLTAEGRAALMAPCTCRAALKTLLRHAPAQSSVVLDDCACGCSRKNVLHG